MNKTEEANDERHYGLIAIAVVFGLAGVYYRFLAPDNTWHVFHYNLVANILFIFGILLGLKAVFAILK
jgi:hypothetical protein